MVFMMDSRSLCIIGIDGLDEYLGPIPCQGLIVILGHPGGGKTTLASQLVYANAVKKGKRSIYITLYETREVLINNLKSLGIDFERLESEGMLKLLSIPTLSSNETIDQLMSLISSALSSFKPDIIVIDGISALLESLESTRARAFLHSILYRISHIDKKLIVVVADLPWGVETVSLGGIEFIADAVFIVKTRIEHKMLMRWLEIRKFRGKQTPIVEIPFAILPNMGIQVLIPLKMVPTSMKEGRELDLRTICKDGLVNFEWAPSIPKGSQILILHPAGSDIPRMLIALIARAALVSKTKTVIITFSEPANGIIGIVENVGKALNLSRDETLGLVKVYGINLTEVWVYGSRLVEYDIVEKENAEIVVLVGLRTVADLLSQTEFISSQFNDVLRYRKLGVTVFRLHAAMDGEYVPTAEYSDGVARVERFYRDDRLVYRIEVLKSVDVTWPRGYVVELDAEALHKCLFS